MIKNKFIFTSIAVSLLAVSCTKEAGWDRGSGVEIGFAANAGSSVTRGLPVESAGGIPDMGVFAYYTGNGAANNWAAQGATTTPNFMNNVPVTNSGGVWSYANPVYWPGAADANVSFFSYSPYANAANGITVNGGTGIPSISYTVPANCSDQPDLMVSALRPDLNKSQGSSPVSFQMRHALTCIGFKASGYGEQITKIKVTGVKTTGTLTVAANGTPIWDTSGAAAGDFEATVDSGIYLDPSSQLVNTGGGYLMMIPQTVPAGAKLVVSVDDGRPDAEFNLGGLVWQAGQRINYSLTITPDAVLLLTPDALVLPSQGGFSQFDAIVENNSPAPWSLSVEVVSAAPLVICDNLPALLAWAAGASAASVFNLDGTTPAGTYSGSGSKTLYAWIPTANTSTNADTFDLIQDDAGAATVSVLQLADYPVSSVSSSYITGAYVGAFWKASQKGERLIRIPVDAARAGDWDASVYWMDPSWNAGDIVFSTSGSDDPGINFNNASEAPADMNNPTNDALYNVPGYVSSATGKAVAGAGNYIHFRVGLTSTYTPTESKPARYALIILRYNNRTKYHLIYVRQGEAPDYLMYPTDANATGTRGTSSVRFSPYNTTATNLGIQQYVQIAADRSNATFTDYPSQAGALFQWAVTQNLRYAYNPVIPHGAPGSWWTTGFPVAWNQAGLTYESCPQGYHRPNDGSVDAGTANNSDTEIAASEIRQSLYSAPPKGESPASVRNVKWGFYADGFFDRRDHNNPSYGNYGESNTAVSWQTKDVGYIGALFYNPVAGSPRQHASLFIPAAGYRISNTGELEEAGGSAYILSSSTFDNANMWYLLALADSSPIQYNSSKASGMPLRCVRNN